MQYGMNQGQNLRLLTTKQLYRELASAAESGWDFSTRWMRNASDLTTLAATSVVPVDLNAFILKMVLLLHMLGNVNLLVRLVHLLLIGPALKKRCGNKPSTARNEEELSNLGKVLDILLCLGKEVLDVKTFTYQRLDWLKRAALLPTSSNETSIESSEEHDFHSSNDLRKGVVEDDAADKIDVIELLFPSVFRAVISLHPVGSVYPDDVAFFSPDEGGNFIHARGFSVHRVFRHITEHAAMALQYWTKD